MNITETRLLNAKLCKALSDLRSFLDGVESVNLVVLRKNMTMKVCTSKSIHHAMQTFLVSPSAVDSNIALSFTASCLEYYGKKVTHKGSADDDIRSDVLSLLHSCTHPRVICENKKIILSDGCGSFDVFTTDNMDYASSACLARSLSFLLAICGKNVSSNIDCFELNEYGICKLTNGVSLTEIINDAKQNSNDEPQML